MSTVEKYRDGTMDFMKGILTILMISSHCLNMVIGKVEDFSNYVNLTTFSGFLFCFGYVCYIAYISKDKLPIKKCMIGFFKTIFAYYVSAMMLWLMLVDDHSWESLKIYLFQIKAASYAEFLLSWAYLYLVIIILNPVIKKIIEKWYWVVLGGIISLALTYVPYENFVIPWLGPIIGMGKRGYFPLCQYFSYFIVGAYLSKNKIKWNWLIFIVCSVTHAYFLYYVLVSGHMPTRWGPHILWIVGGYFYIYMYYILSSVISEHFRCRLIEWIGKNTLIFLVISNFFVFLGDDLMIRNWNVDKHCLYVLYCIITFLGCFIGTWLIKRVKICRR